MSGLHCSTVQIDPADHVLICSVGSLARQKDLVGPILGDPKTFLVIDEAHHSAAKTYRELIGRLRSGKGKRLLGLTATPTRTAEAERGTLASLFGNRMLYEIPIGRLIEQGYLARPLPVRVATHTRAEAGMTTADVEHLARFHDLSEAWMQRIASQDARNGLIVSHY